LRYCRQCQVLYAELRSVASRNKSKRAFPASEVDAALAKFAPFPGPSLLMYPIVRNMFLLRLINMIRVRMGRPSWLFTHSVVTEYRKAEDWLANQRATYVAKRKAMGASPSAVVTESKLIVLPIEREMYQTEMLDQFHVATAYHRWMRLGALLVLLACSWVVFVIHFETCLGWYLKYVKRYTREQVMSLMREVLEQHVAAEVPTKYSSLIPPPVVKARSPTGEVMYTMQVVELVSQNGTLSVVFIPFPFVGPKTFFESVGNVLRDADGVVIEGVASTLLHMIGPQSFLPMNELAFPAAGMTTRFYDILRSPDPPPALHPGGGRDGWSSWLKQAFSPLAYRMVYAPATLAMSRAEARLGWGCIRDILESPSLLEGTAHLHPDKADQDVLVKPPTMKHYVLAVPWSVWQIVNLQASLIKAGYKVKSVHALDWVNENYLGEHFCNYFDIR